MRRVMAVVALSCSVGCAPCGGDPQEAVPFEVPAAAGSGAQDGSGAAAVDDEPAAAIRVEQVASLPELGALAAVDLVEDLVVRVADTTLQLDRLGADGSASSVASHELTAEGAVVAVRARLPRALALHADPPAAPGEPSLSGTLSSVFFGGMAMEATARLPGAPIDAWLAPTQDAAWVLVRQGRAGQLLRYPLNGGEIGAPTAQLPTSPAPVGLVPSADGARLLVPCFDGRAVEVVDTTSGTLVDTIRVDVRPTTAWLTGDVLTVSAPNASQARVVDLTHGSDGQVAPLPFSPSAWAHDGERVIVAAAGPGAVARLKAPWLEVAAQRDALGDGGQVLPLAMELVDDILWVVDASPTAPALWVLDADSLEVRARQPLDAPTTRVQVHEGALLTVSPVNGAAARWRLVSDR